MNRKILFLVDHKHRDLPSLTLIGCHLRRLGFEPHFVGLSNELDLIARVDPQFIVLPKPIYDYERLIKWKAEGRRLIVIETEGNPQDLEFELRIRVPPDLHLFWNETIADRYRARLERSGTVVRVVGYPRSDFLHPRLDGVFPSRQELLTRYGLDSGRPTLTIATSGQDSHFSDERVKAKRKRRSRSFARTAEYLDIVANMRELRDKTTDFVTRLVGTFPDLNIAIKPHPNENAVFWASFVESLQRPNVALVVGEPINHLLRVSDFHLSYNVCTTTIEAMLAGLPAAELQTARSGKLYGEEHLALPSYRVLEFKQLADAVKTELYGAAPVSRAAPDSLPARVREYVADFLFAFDGARCETYARVIAEWAGASPASARGAAYLAAHPRLAAFYLALRARTAARRVLTARFPGRSAKQAGDVYAPVRDGSRSVTEIKGTLVDAEYGLYDNRMRAGDESAWIERFSRAGIAC